MWFGRRSCSGAKHQLGHFGPDFAKRLAMVTANRLHKSVQVNPSLSSKERAYLIIILGVVELDAERSHRRVYRTMRGRRLHARNASEDAPKCRARDRKSTRLNSSHSQIS